MRSVTSFAGLAGSAALLLATTGAWAGPTISAWELQHTANQERVRLRWDEPAAVEVKTFPAARQVVISIPEAQIGDVPLASLDFASSRLIDSARVQSVTMADGRDGVQLTVDLKTWVEPKPVSGTSFLTIDWAVTGESGQGNANDVITLSNDDIAALDSGRFGSRTAPAMGAGQAGGGGTDPFYVPPDLTSDQKKSFADRTDLGMLRTQEVLNRYVDLDFKDASLQDVIRIIAAKLDLNIIITPAKVKGTVTVSLRQVPLRAALEALLKSNELAYKIEDGGIVRIVDRKDVVSSDKELVNDYITINWIDATSIERVLKNFITDEGGSVTSAKESNLIIIQDVPERMTELRRIVAAMDVPEKQVRMEMRMVDMTTNASRQLGLQTGFASTATESRIPIDGDGSVDPANALVFPVSQGGLGAASLAATGISIDHLNDISIFGNRYSLNMRLRAQEDRGEAVTLAAPTILSLNNLSASIEIKRQIPYRSATNTDQGSVATVTFKDVGTKVDITPRITNNGHVMMEIEPEQKILVGTDPATGVPVVDERKATTSVIVKDENTVALGGLRQFDSTNSETGAPWLLRLPVLGWLFKSTDNSQRKVELYLFVTPHIIKNPETTVYETGMYEKIDYNWDLPDFYYDEVRSRKGPNEMVDPYSKHK